MGFLKLAEMRTCSFMSYVNINVNVNAGFGF